MLRDSFRWFCFAVSRVIAYRGRAGRFEAWSFVIYQTLICAAFALFDYYVTGFPIVLPLYLALTFVPTILLMIRRLHDCGFSGWWILIAIIPPINFFLLCWAPDPMQPNDYGTTERLPRTDDVKAHSAINVDGIEYLTPPGNIRDRQAQNEKLVSRAFKNIADREEKKDSSDNA